MRYLSDGIYSQQYFSEDFFLLYDVLEYERERLSYYDVMVTSYEMRIKTKGDVLIFFLVLFFKSSIGDDLSPRENKLFNYKN